MKAFTVNSKDLFDPKKNPTLQLSVESVLANPNIKKQWLTPESEHIYNLIQELKLKNIELQNKVDTANNRIAMNNKEIKIYSDKLNRVEREEKKRRH